MFPGKHEPFQACHVSVEQELENSISIREHFENCWTRQFPFLNEGQRLDQWKMSELSGS